jgi:uncharacterized protein involved in exopolysaccharide biosynthesis
MRMNSNQPMADDELDLFGIVRLAWQRRWLVIAITALFGVVAVVLALLTEPVYRAQVVVTEVRDNSATGGGASSLLGQLGGLANLAGLSVGADDASRSNQAVLKSRHLAEEFVRRNKLVEEMFRKSTLKPTLWRAVESFKSGVVTISDDVRAGKTTIAMEWTDPVLTARWANGYVALANELIRARALEDAGRNVAYLKTQIAQTSVVELQRVMYALIQSETKTLMLANARAEYAFAVVDPAVVPELRIRPARTLMVLTGGVLGFCAAMIIVVLLNFIARSRRRLGSQAAQ